MVPASKPAHVVPGFVRNHCNHDVLSMEDVAQCILEVNGSSKMVDRTDYLINCKTLVPLLQMLVFIEKKQANYYYNKRRRYTVYMSFICPLITSGDVPVRKNAN